MKFQCLGIMKKKAGALAISIRLILAKAILYNYLNPII